MHVRRTSETRFTGVRFEPPLAGNTVTKAIERRDAAALVAYSTAAALIRRAAAPEGNVISSLPTRQPRRVAAQSDDSRQASLPPVGPAPAKADGRRLRTEASRSRIVEAMLSLVREGGVAPSAEAVAQRAGVGLRTVFRLFKDMDSLYGEMSAVMVRKLTPLREEAFAAEDWRGRVDELLDRRQRIFEEILPFKTAADAHRAMSPFLQAEHRQVTQMQRETLVSLLPESALRDAARLEALDLATSFESWRRLRHDQGLDPARAILVLRRLVQGLLDR